MEKKLQAIDLMHESHEINNRKYYRENRPRTTLTNLFHNTNIQTRTYYKQKPKLNKLQSTSIKVDYYITT